MANGFSFYEGSSSENTAPRITVRKGGQLVLTRGAVEMLGEDVDNVQVGYNAETQVVAIRAASEDAKGQYRLRSQGTNGLHLVTGKRFFAHYSLDVSKARTFDAEQIDEGLVGFCLNGAAEKPAESEGTGKKTRTARQPAEAAA